MADKKISQLTSIQGSATAQNDLVGMVYADTGTTKKISRAELNNAIVLDILDIVDINGGNIDGTIIGAATPAAGTFTALTANSGADVTGNITVSGSRSSAVTDAMRGSSSRQLSDGGQMTPA